MTSGTRFGRLAALVVLTIGATVLMVTISAGTIGLGFLDDDEKAAKKPAVIPKIAVVVREVRPEQIEIIDAYAGMLKPFEQYKLGFEIGGEVAVLGQNAEGQPIEMGDFVKEGQVLARLDERILTAQLSESRARLERAQTDMNRANELRQRDERTITQEAFQRYVTDLQLAEAGLKMAETKVEHALLTAPVTGRIAKRYVKPGTTVSPQQVIMDLIEVDRLLLTVGVPESRVNELKVGQPVHIDLLARDKFGQSLPDRQGEVYRVSPQADDKSGLFQIEVLVRNSDHELRPGLVATARIVIDTMEGLRLPLTSAVFRDGQTIVFAVGDAGRARAVALNRWIEQGADVILPLDELASENRQVIVRGQHRLIDGREVDVLNVESPATEHVGEATTGVQGTAVRVQP